MNTKLKPRLVASYDIRRGNGAGYSEGKDTGEVNNKGKYKQEEKGSKLQGAKGSN